jgi:hypothetical protein
MFAYGKRVLTMISVNPSILKKVIHYLVSHWYLITMMWFLLRPRVNGVRQRSAPGEDDLRAICPLAPLTKFIKVDKCHSPVWLSVELIVAGPNTGSLCPLIETP